MATARNTTNDSSPWNTSRNVSRYLSSRGGCPAPAPSMGSRRPLGVTKP
uniref:Uncharacterized protein n=1 Tax=Arundo donax TaxID=35708 RepID=A0A0A8XPE3_ARUDO